MERVKLDSKLEVECADGSIYELTPGQGGHGLQVRAAQVPLAARTTGSGRPPRESTLRLRERLEADARAGLVGPGPDYIEWLLAVDGGLERAVAANTVYRERRAVVQAHPDTKVQEARGRKKAEPGKGNGTPGRKPSRATILLRERLDKDHTAGGVRPAKDYVKWLAKQARVSTAKARPIVYRERKRYG